MQKTFASSIGLQFFVFKDLLQPVVVKRETLDDELMKMPNRLLAEMDGNLAPDAYFNRQNHVEVEMGHVAFLPVFRPRFELTSISCEFDYPSMLRLHRCF